MATVDCKNCKGVGFVTCPTCAGRAIVNGEKCPRCARFVENPGQVICPKCGGHGYVNQ
jgi:RNA polymerase subunit RPABC4/transcription elongation factor Spt4